MNDEQVVALLQELIYARGPCGQEEEVRVICKRELSKCCDKVWTDEAGNVVGQLLRDSNNQGATSAPVIRVMAHMDEIGMMVKRIKANGTLRVVNLGGLRPGNIGQTPVDILADNMIIPGVLSLGSQHVSHETPNVDETKYKAMSWSHMHVFANKSADELKRNGVHPGTRVVISQERRKIFDMEECIGGYFMDDRAAITISLVVASFFQVEGIRPHQDVYFVMTTEEERDGVGAAYASRKLPGGTTIAIEVGPISDEYGTEFRIDPIVGYGDSRGLYTKSLADELVNISLSIGQNPQTAVWESFCSDASVSKSYGQASSIALISVPTLNTHGFEIIPRGGIQACAKLLFAFLNNSRERRVS